MKNNKWKSLLSVLLALVMALMLGAAALAEPEGTVPAAQEKAAGQEITYVGGVVLRSNVRDDGSSLLEIACVLANQPYVLLAQPSLWDVQVQGGTAPYTVEADLCYRSFDSTDTSNSWPISESFTLSDLLFEHTFTEAGRYFWQFTVTDAAGQTLIFQTRVFETYTDADEADATTVAGKVNSVVSQLISDGMSDYRRALVLHDWLINNADYDQTYTYYEAAGVLLYGTGVCDSYARAYQMLLAAAGVESMIVTGTAGSDANGWEAHGWNLVKLGGTWYHIDCTWDDPVGGEENHAYFCLTDEELSADHKWNRPGSSIDSGMLVPDAQGGVYSDVEAATDYDFTFSDIASFEAGLDAQVAAQAYTPVIAVYTQGNVSDIQDELFTALSAKLQEYANQGLLSGETSYTMSGSTIKLTLPWLTESSYVRIDETEILLYAGESVTVTPAVLSPADAQLTWSVSDPAVLAVSGSSGATVTALAEGTAILTATAPSGLTDDVTVTVKPAWQSNFDVQMTEMEDGTVVFAWDAVPGATEYALIAVSGGTQTQVAFTEACSLTVDASAIDATVCDSLYVAARRVLAGETVLTHTSKSLTPPDEVLTLELIAEQRYDTVYTGGSYQPVLFTLEIANYDELAAKYGNVYPDFYIESSADESLGSYGYNFSDNRSASAFLYVQPTVTGSLTLTATVQLADLTKSVEIPITVADPESLTISYPERIDVKAGEDFTHVLTFNGEACPWLASNSIGYNQTLISAPDSQSPAAYAFTALESGISHLNLSVYYSNLPVETNSIVFIADSEGNVPELKPEITLESVSTELYLAPDYSSWELAMASVGNYALFCEIVPDFTAPVWTVSSDSADFPVFCNGDNSWASVTTSPCELTQAGTVNVTLTCTIGQESDVAYCTDSVVIPVTVSESPVTDPSVLLPASINTQVGQAFTLDAMAALPADWNGATPRLQLLSNNDCFELTAADNGVYSCMPLQPGVYDVVFGWQLVNLMHYPNARIIVTDENGNLPNLTFNTNQTVYYDKLYANGGDHVTLAYFEISNLNDFTAVTGAEQVDFTLASSGDESLGTYTLASAANSTYIINTATPTATGTVTLTLTASVGNESDDFYHTEDFTFTFVIEELDPALYAVSLPTTVEGRMGENLYIYPTVDCPAEAVWSVNGASLDSTDVLTYAGSSEDGTAYVFTPLAPGIARAGVYVYFRNYTVYASTIVLVADEEGNLPQLALNVSDYELLSPLYERIDHTNQAFHGFTILNLADLQNLIGAACAPSWSFTAPEDAPNITLSDNVGNANLYVDDTGITAGSWEISVTVTLGTEGSDLFFTKTIPVPLVIEADPRTEASQLPQRVDLAVGDTFTVSKLGRLPEGWSAPLPFIQQLNCTDVIELVSQTDTEATFRVLSAGIHELNLFWQLNNLVDSFSIDVYVADESGVVPGTVVAVFPSFDVSDFMYLGGSTYIGNCRIDNYSDLTALYGGEPQWSVTSLEGVAVTSYGSGRYFSLELGEMPSATASADFRVDCVWGEATWSGDFHMELRAHTDGLPTGLDVQDAYYLTQGESLALDPAALVLPAGFDLTEASPRIGLSWDSDLPLGGFSNAFSYQFEEGGVLRIMPVKQDICKVTCIWQYKNLSVTRDVLLYSADEAGEFLSLEPDMRAEAPDVQLFYLGGNHMTCNSMSIMNADALSAYATGDPQWTITQLSGEEGLLGGSGTGTYLQVDLLRSAELAGDNVYRVDMTWGDISWSKEFTLRFTELEAGLPTLSLPASISVKAGESVDIVASELISPADWSSDDGCTPHLYLWNNDTFIDSCEDYEEGGSVITLTPTVPGVYPISLIWEQQNISRGGDFTVIVTDENGELPAIAPELACEGQFDVLLADGNSETFSYASVFVRNWSELSAVFGDSMTPVWTVTTSQGGPEFETELHGGAVYANAVCDTLQPGDYEVAFHFTVSDPDLAPYCSGSLTLNLSVRENPQSDADYAGIPAAIEAQVGQTFSLDKLATMDADWDGPAPYMYISSGAENFTLVDQSDSEVVYQPLASGIFKVDINWQLANVLASRTVTIRVADENGVVPMPEIDMNVMYDDDTVFIVGSGDSGNINSHRIDNYNELSQLLSGTPVWTVTAVENCTDDQLQIEEMHASTTVIWLYPHPTEPCTVRYKVTCTWDGAVWEGESALTFVEADPLPIAISVPNQIVLSIGSTYWFDPTNVRPLNRDVVNLGADTYIDFTYFNSSYGSVFTYTRDGNATIFSGSTPGVYPVLLRWILPNYHLEKEVRIIIRNEDGTLPVTTFDLTGSESNFYLDGNLDTAFSCSIRDYFSKQDTFAGDVIWSVTQVSGSENLAPSGEFIVGEVDGDMTARYVVTLGNRPTAVGTYLFRVTAEWDGTVQTNDVVLYVQPAQNEQPIEGIDAQDVTIKVGDTLSIEWVPIPLLPEGSVLNIDGASNHYRLLDGMEEAFTYIDMVEPYVNFRADKTGIYQYYLKHWVANYCYEKTVTVTVTDENGNLPLPDIELSAYVVDPMYAGGNDLFMASITPVDSQAMEQFALMVEDNPVWTVEPLNGSSEVTVNPFYNLMGCSLSFNEPPQAGQYSYRVTLTWGGKTFTQDLTATVQSGPDTPPTGLTLPDTLTIQANTDQIVSYENVILPQGWGIEGTYIFVNLWDDNVNGGYMEYVNTTGSYTFGYRFSKPGIYNCTWYAQCANFRIEKPVTIWVTDENGDIPGELTMIANTGDDLYAGGNELDACSAYLWESEALEYAATTDEAPQWSFSVLSGPHTFTGRFFDEYPYSYVLDFTEPPAAGTSVVRIILEWGDLYQAKQVTVTVNPGPDSAPTGLNFPDEVTVMVNEALTVTYDNPFLPEDWGIEGQSFFANLWETGESSGHMTRVDVTEANTFAYVFDEPGIYECEWFARCGNYTMKKPVTVKVTDENGNVPGKLVFSNTFYPRLYLEGDYIQLASINIDYDTFLSLSETMEGEPVFEIVESSHELLMSTYGGWMCNLFVSPMPEEPCTVTYTVRVTWGDMSEDISGSTEILHAENGAPGELSYPDYIRLAPREVHTFTLADLIQPSNWSTGYDDEQSIRMSIVTGSWEDITCEYLSDEEFTVSVRTPGVYKIKLRYSCANFSRSKEVYLCIEDSDGTLWMPEDAFSLLPSEVTWYKGGNDPYLLEAVIDPDIYDLWMKLYPEGPQWFDNVVTTPTGIPGHFAISLKDTDIEVNEYSLEVGFSWGDCGTAIEAWLIVEDPGVTLPEKLRLTDTFELTPGQGFAIIHDELLPEGWNIGGSTGLFDVIIFNEEAGILERDSSVDGVTSFQAVEPGKCLGQIHWFCENFYIIQDFTVVVTEPVLNVAAQQTEYSLQPGMCVQTVLTGDTALIDTAQWSTSDASVAEVDANGAITALDAGTATVTARLTGTNGASCELDFTIRVLANARQMILPAALTTIESEAFYGTGAQVIIVPQSVTTIGSSAFAASDGLVIVRIPASVTVFGDDILANSNAAILCESGSAAEAYALANEIPVYIIK